MRLLFALSLINLTNIIIGKEFKIEIFLCIFIEFTIFFKIKPLSRKESLSLKENVLDV